MNKQRRKAIYDIIERLESIQNAIEEVLNEEQEAYDNMPESFQDSERGETISEAIDNLEYAMGAITDCTDCLHDATGE